MPKVKDIIKVIERRAPLSLMLDFDSAGLNFGDGEDDVKGILLAQNVTYSTLEECKDSGCNLLITHHPSVFGEEIDRYTQSILDRAEKYGINLYSCHTNLDCCDDGLNGCAAKLLGMKNLTVIDGCARRGEIEECRLDDFVKHTAKVLKDVNVKYVGDGKRKIKTVAICTGAGGRDEELLEYARLNKIDCIVGGESKLSIALAAKDYGIALIDVGHYDSEILCVKIFAQWLEEYKDLLRESASDINPYKSAKEIL